MIKLLLVSPKTEPSKGGIAVWTDAFLENCGKYGISCDLLNIATIGERAKQGNAKRNFVDEFFRTKAIFKNLHSILIKQTYDVAHINTSCGTFGIIRDYITAHKIRRKQPQCKLIFHFHCDIQDQCKSKVSRFFLSKIVKISNNLLVLNNKNHQYLFELFDASSEIVPNFINESMIRTDSKYIRSEIKEAVFVGYVRPEKGIRELYELALSNPKITFRLIGEVHNDIKMLDKPQNVVLCGKKSHLDIISELDEADVFVFLSHSEGFSIALLEAMSRGLPSIATDVGANKEMIENKGGVIVKVGDISAMEIALDFLRDSQKREEMSAWNLEKVKSCYTVEKIISLLLNIYISN